MKAILQAAWSYLLPGGRIVAIATNLETLYAISECLSSLQVRNVEVVQSVINRLENRGIHQVFAALDPMFIVSGEKGE